MSDRRTIRFTLNGRPERRTVEVRRLLSDFLRDDLLLTGTHVGCEHGVCGACTVLVDRRPVRACLMLAVQVDGCELSTVEGLASSMEELHPVQRAFWDKHGLQCGFCTPGMVMAAVALLEENPSPSEADIRKALAGNVCRCTGYVFIVEAVQEAARQLARV